MPLAEVRGTVIAATLGSEDHRFFRHAGVDPRGVARAALPLQLLPTDFCQGLSTPGTGTQASDVRALDWYHRAATLRGTPPRGAGTGNIPRSAARRWPLCAGRLEKTREHG